ncbi:von Willebrand factor A domain-containing protein 5A, partial [Serendipita sp. 398]
STAMCEGIARAGQGTAVFVAEGEKPDAKLMGLLKAARGGVIEDLTVDWGDSEDAVEEEDDEFEMISSSKADDNLESSASPPPQSQPPLNLFDESHVETPAEVGAQKAIVLLGPPPKVQQAPKSDKLPIPLYPGFRCSIFAIVKRGANPGPHCASVKITGKVLGREVILQVPVSPVSVHSGIVEGKVDGGKLLHTLAAKALIQAFEDMAKTPENKAQIERLGKRYSLASSATSFVAIDEDTKDEIQEKIIQEKIEEAAVDKKQESHKDKDMGRQTAVRRRSSKPASSATVTGYTPSSPYIEFNSSSATSGFDSYGRGAAPSYRRSMVAPSQPIAPGGPAMASYQAPDMPLSHQSRSSVDSEISSTVELMRANIDQMALRGERLDSLEDRSSNLAVSAQSFRKGAARSKGGIGGWFGSFGASLGRSPTSAESSSASLRAPAAASVPQASPPLLAKREVAPPPRAQTLSIESIARAQNFDGSFPCDDNHLRLIVGANRLSRARELPPTLKQLGVGSNAQDATKKLIWATVITFVCLQKKFGTEKDSWEMLVEKAKEYIEKELIDLGLEESIVAKTVNELESVASALF